MSLTLINVIGIDKIQFLVKLFNLRDVFFARNIYFVMLSWNVPWQSQLRVNEKCHLAIQRNKIEGLTASCQNSHKDPFGGLVENPALTQRKLFKILG